MLKEEEEKVKAYPLVTEKTVKRRNSIVPFLWFATQDQRLPEFQSNYSLLTVLL